MKKAKAIILTLVLTPFIAGIYGILHDQLTYSICPEYYTKFKFIQFGLISDPTGMPSAVNPRLLVSVVGFMATWWVGSIIGTVFGLLGLFHKDSAPLFRVLLKSVIIAICVAFAIGLIGLFIGSMINPHSIYLSTDVMDEIGFIMVGSMHNFGYIGGLIGLIAGSIHILRKRKVNYKP